MKKILLLILIFILFAGNSSAQDDSYYSTLNPSSASFITDLKTRIRSPYTRVSYDNYISTNINNFASYSIGGDYRAVNCVYSTYRYVYIPPFAWTPSSPFSREHIWCYSWQPTHGSTSTDQYSDQHHLFPTHQNNANSVRSNHPLGIVSTVISSFLESKYGRDVNNNLVYEPCDNFKGDAARALLYMCVRYDDINGYDWSFNWLNNTKLPELNEGAQNLNTLLLWHIQDPPDKWEVNRNNYVQSIQQNRNPFVDHPEYVYYINFNDLSKLTPTYSAEPSNYVTDFSVSVNSNSLTLSWTDAAENTQLPSGYLLEAYNANNYFIPIDGQVYSDDEDLTDGEALVNILYSAQNNYTFSGINPSSKYYFRMYSYNGDGTSRNYKIDGNTVPTAYYNGGSVITYTTALLDNFNRADNNSIGNVTEEFSQIPWNEIETVSPTSISINSNRLRMGSTTIGRDFAYLDMSTVTDYPLILNTTTDDMTWAINMRQTRDNPSGFDNNYNGIAFILGKTTSDITTGNGYAVVLGNEGTTDPIRLAIFSNGINLNSKFTDIISSGDYGNEYLSIKVKYSSAGDNWSLFVESGASNFPQSDPRNTSTLVGTASNSTYTSVSLMYVGCLWNHSSGGSNYAYFDDIYLTDPYSTTPVELISLSSFVNRNDVILNWTTSNEINNYGFEIEKKENTLQTSEWLNAGFVKGSGTTNETKNYSFVDRNLQSGKYKYRLKQIDYNGNFQYFELNSIVEIGTPQKYYLSQNYPNPFNPVTKIDYELPYDGKVVLKIYDITGRELYTLVNDYKQAGYNSVEFNASNLASGVYFYSLNTEKFTKVLKMVLIK